MPIVDALGTAAGAVLATIFLALEALVLGFTVRRVLGVRVGWPRTIAVALAMLWGLQISFNGIATYAGMTPENSPPHALGAFILMSAIAILWAFALGALILVVAEIIVPTGSLPRARDVVFGWHARRRRSARYRTLMWILSKYGLRSVLWGRPAGHGPEGQARLARSARQAMEEAGVTFVKVGQMLSTRADLLPAAFIEEFSRLQSTADPLPIAELRGVLDKALPDTRLLAQFVDEPLASASTGQVHSATLSDGRRVVVKIQRPEAAALVETDISIMQRFAARLERNAPWARRFGLARLVDGFAASLSDEMDYRMEAANMAAMRAHLAPRGVHVPDTILATERVLIMERLTGAPIGAAATTISALDPGKRREAAATLLDAVLTGIVVDGIFHADLHPGNVFLSPDGEVGLIDFGSVGRLDAIARRNLATLLWAIDADDPLLATDALLELADAPDGVDERSLRRGVGLLITRYRSGFGAGGSVTVFAELLALVVAHGLVIPPQLAAAMRSLGALEGTLTLLDPELDLVSAARETGRTATSEITPERVKDEFLVRAMRFVPLLENLPHRLDQITSDLEAGRFTVRTRVVSEPEDRAFIRSVTQLLVVSILAAAAVLGGVLLLRTDGGPVIFGDVSVFLTLGALLSFSGFVLALRAVAHVFRDSRT